MIVTSVCLSAERVLDLLYLANTRIVEAHQIMRGQRQKSPTPSSRKLETDTGVATKTKHVAYNNYYCVAYDCMSALVCRYEPFCDGHVKIARDEIDGRT